MGGLSARGIHRIVLLRPNHRLGNTLLMTPLLDELERRFPGAEIDVVTGCEAAAEVFVGFRQIRRIYQLTRRPGHHPLHLLKTLRTLRRSRYDLAIDCARGSRSGRFLLYLSAARHALGLPASVRELAQGGDAWRLAMERAPRHFALDGVHALRCVLDGETTAAAAPFPPLRLMIGNDERAAGKCMLDALLAHTNPSSRGPILVLFPNATGNKRLPGEWWQRFIDRLTTLAPDLRIIEMVAAHGQSQLDSRFPAFYSSDIRRMAALMSHCDAYISADCGVMHLACAAGVPTLGLFTRANLERYRPYGAQDDALCVASRGPEETATAAAEGFLRGLASAHSQGGDAAARLAADGN